MSGNFNQNEEIDIRFDASVYATLSNPTGPTGWDVAPGDGSLTQPQGGPCGPCAPGDFAPFYMDSTPSTGGTFTLDYTLAPGNLAPAAGGQSFFVQQFDNSGLNPVQTDSGTTTPFDAVPEPASWALSGVTLLALAVLGAVRSRRTVSE